jgi:lantibiotic modifying enzyme
MPASSPPGWQALVDDQSALGTTIRDRVLAIAAELATSHVDQPGLWNGSAGLALLFGELSQHDPDGDHAEIACRFLDHAMETVAQYRDASLFRGLAGVGWVYEHLQGAVFDPPDDEDSPCEAIDSALHRAVGAWHGSYDLVDGLVGIGVYALARLPAPRAAACLDAVIDRLAQLAEHHGDRVAWLTAAEHLSFEARAQRADAGVYNLGVAHGIPGVIAFLARACSASSRPLVDGALTFLRAQRRDDDLESFPAYVGPGRDPEPARTAWCYGEPGIACALLGGARSTLDPALEREAIELARRSASNRMHARRVEDAGFCHGTAGLLHLFDRMFQATRDRELETAALYWLDRTLALEVPRRPGLLTGSAGMALALLATIAPTPPGWDAVFLTTIP